MCISILLKIILCTPNKVEEHIDLNYPIHLGSTGSTTATRSNIQIHFDSTKMVDALTTKIEGLIASRAQEKALETSVK
jgi:hypothetical protein